VANRPIWLSTTKDGKIANDQGNVIVLKGLARPSLEWDVNGQYLNSLDIATMRSWVAAWPGGHYVEAAEHATDRDRQEPGQPGDSAP
jgi:hypothetical protein